MGLRNFKIGIKLAAGFLLVVAIFVGVSVFQLFSLTSLSSLQDEGAGRANDAVEIQTIANRLEGVYTVIADAIINRNIAESKKDFAQVKKTAGEDIKRVYELVDTQQEKAWAKDFENGYSVYLGLFENKMLPILEKEKTTSNDEQEIRLLDGAIDQARDKTSTPLVKIVNSLKNEQQKADEHFDSTASNARLWTIIISVIAAVLGMIIAFIISIDITRPLAQLVSVAREMANGNMQQSIDIQRKDEVGILAGAFKQMSDSLKTAVNVIQRIMNGVSQGDLTNHIDEAGMKGDLSLIKDSINQ